MYLTKLFKLKHFVTSCVILILIKLTSVSCESDLTKIASKSADDIPKKGRNERSAQNILFGEPTFAYGYSGPALNPLYQPSLNMFPEYPVEAGVYYNYPNQHGDLPVFDESLYPINYPYPTALYPNLKGSGYPTLNNGYQPSNTFGYQPSYASGFSSSTGGYPGYQSRSVTPLPYDYNSGISTYSNSNPSWYQSGVSTGVISRSSFSTTQTPGVHQSQPGTYELAGVSSQRRFVNRGPVGENTGKSGGDLPTPGLSWNVPNRQF